MMRTTQSLRLKSCVLSPGAGLRTGMSVAGLRPFLLAGYQACVDCQKQVSALWRDQSAWTRKAIQRGAYGQVLIRPLHP
jgi:hypothetical protein